MSSAKARVQEMIERLPDDVSIADIQYHLYVIRKIEEGDQAIADGRVVTQEEIEKDFQ
jgi:predicted transcriptional regulator